jgi:hypothetical protein
MEGAGMSWLDRLKNLEKGPGEAVPKVPEGAFGTFGTPSGGHIGNFSPPEHGIEPAESWGELTDRLSEALAILRAEPTLRRVFKAEQDEHGIRLALALRRPDGRIVCGELVLPPGTPLAALGEAMRAPHE